MIFFLRLEKIFIKYTRYPEANIKKLTSVSLEVLIMMKFFSFFFAGLVILGLSLFVLIRILNFYPDKLQTQEILCTSEAPPIEKDTKIKVMSWNVQYMAGRNYLFYYENVDGRDVRPSSEDITLTTKQVAEIIKQEQPDVVLLQEIDDGAGRTDNKDQMNALLQEFTENKYPCRSEAFYWKSSYVPHNKIKGSVGMKLVTLSKYKIVKSFRYSLPQMPQDWLTMQFYLKRGILEVLLPYNQQPSKYLHIMNTHLSAFAQGTNNMKEQVNEVLRILSDLDAQKAKWIIGGDFNLLPSALQRQRLSVIAQKEYNKITELKPLLAKYNSVPSLKEANGKKNEILVYLQSKYKYRREKTPQHY